MPMEDLSLAVERAIAGAQLGLMGSELILLGAGFLALIAGAWLSRENQRVAGYVAFAGTFASLLYLVTVSAPSRLIPQEAFNGLFIQDGFAIFFKYLFLIATWLTILLSMRYLDEEAASHGEYYAMLCFASVGMMFMASGNDLLTIYVGLELMALSVYVLVGFLKANRRSNEAAMKYFVLGAFSSAFLVYGISLFYGITGSTSLDAVRGALSTGGGTLATVGLIMMSVGLGFKVAAVPFHAWAPDAYEGAPTPITAYVSVASKAAAFAILMRILLVGLYGLRTEWTVLLWVMAAATITLGNLVAIVQDNVKRMLAYSSIAHAGYTLLGVLAAGASAPTTLRPEQQIQWMADLQGMAQGGVLVYLFAYTFMNVGAFAVVTMLRRQEVIGDRVKDFAGLFHRAPHMAIAMAIFLLSLGGIPPTAGFVGKLFLFGAAVKAGLYGLAVIAVLNTAVSIYFYFRIVRSMWVEEATERAPYAWSWQLSAVVLVAVVFTLLVGVWPVRFLNVAQDSILSLAEPFGVLSRTLP